MKVTRAPREILAELRVFLPVVSSHHVPPAIDKYYRQQRLMTSGSADSTNCRPAQRNQSLMNDTLIRFYL